MKTFAMAMMLAAVPYGSAGAETPLQQDAGGLERRAVLTRRSEDGFRRFMEAVRGGRLGEDVHAVNVGVSGGSVRLELLRRNGPAGVVRLTAPTFPTRAARYFDVEALENASPDDLARIGRLLDEAFTADPFEWRAHSDVRPRAAPPRETPLMHSASLAYTVVVIALGALGLLASIAVLCLSGPTSARQPSDR